MLHWSKSILTAWVPTNKCWWCGSSDLSREHKFKKTDLDLLYGKSVYAKPDRILLLRYKDNQNHIHLQSSSSDFLKFDQALCKTCNNTRSSRFDAAYTDVIKYYLHNDEQIKKKGFIDFSSIFESNWKDSKINFYRYCVKHVCSRLVESRITPSENLINFLNGTENLKDIKFVFQIKKYVIGENENQIGLLFLGPLNMFEQDYLFIGKKLTSIASWYTVKQFSINYLYKKYLLNDGNAIYKHSRLKIDIIDFSKWEGKSFILNSESLNESYGDLIEQMEYFPFQGGAKEFDHYNYILQYNNTL